MLATLPFLTPALTLLHQAIARGMLGSFTSDALERRVADLSESRGAAISAEGRTNAAIASALVIGVGAVEKNVTSIFQKLGLDDSGSDHRRVLAVLAWLQR